MKTISYELAKRLDKVGVKEKSHFSWIKYHGYTEVEKEWSEPFLCSPHPLEELREEDEIYAAYTLDEILEILPTEILVDDTPFCLRMLKENHGNFDCFDFHYAYILEKIPNGIATHETGSSEDKDAAEAAGNLLAWCIENEYVQVEDINGGRK